MLYGGTEFGARKEVGLFDKDDNFCDKQKDWQPYLKNLRQMKRRLPLSGEYRLEVIAESFVLGKYNSPGRKVRGVFSVKGNCGSVPVDLPDGLYRDLVDGREVAVADGRIDTDGRPVIVSLEG